MATLQKFKLLATQCAMTGSPSRSPNNSPVFHLRRRKTLRMLLSRSNDIRSRLPRQEESPDRQRVVPDKSDENKNLLTHTLKDLFISSPPFEENGDPTEKRRENGDPSSTNPGNGSTARRVVGGFPRPLSAVFRYRLLRRAWRPVLVAIPE